MHSATWARSGPVLVPDRPISPTIFVARGECTATDATHDLTPRRISPSGKSGSFAMQWGPAPAAFPSGARMAVLQGDPRKAEPFIACLWLPEGYELPPHTHPNDEHLTVITGTLWIGRGARRDDATIMALRAGGTVTARANAPHYATAIGVTVVQINAIGPFDLTFVNPSDAPTSASEAASPTS